MNGCKYRKEKWNDLGEHNKCKVYIVKNSKNRTCHT